MAARSCLRCGAPLPPDAAFCGACGGQVFDAGPPPSPAEPHEAEPYEPGKQGLPQWAWGAIALAVAVATIAGVLVATGDGGTEPTGTEPGEVFLEPADHEGEDPFTDSVDTNSAPPPVRVVAAPVPTTAPPGTTPPSTGPAPSPSPVGVRSVQGPAPGLYGGTRDESACDAERMIDFLTNEPEKAAAWAAVQGITADRIPDFVRGLTPVVLRADTRVTNHGYRDGRATPLQSVLEAGTAVLVDDLGIPRVKCGCGNPLLPPVAQTGGVTYTGTPWPGFSPTTVIVVVNTVNIRVETFVLVDLSNGGYYVRPKGTPPAGTLPNDGEILIDRYCDLYPEECRPPDLVAPGQPTGRPGEPTLGTGDVQVTLRWSSTADLDLAVIDPSGEMVSFDNPTSASGGQLDVDSNGDCSATSASPVENVFWPPGQSPDGEYTIVVSYFGECQGGTGPQAFELTVLMGGAPVDVQLAASTGGELTFELMPALEEAPQPELAVVLPATGTLNAPGDRLSGKATKTPGGAGSPPGAPQGPNAAPGPGSLTVSWTPPASGGVVESYEVTVMPGGTSIVVPASSTSVTIPGLQPGTDHQINVVARNAAGSSPSATTSGTPGATGGSGEQPPPPPPEPETLEEYCNRLYGPPPGPGEIDMEWTLCMHDPTQDEPPDPGSLPQPIPPPEEA